MLLYYTLIYMPLCLILNECETAVTVCIVVSLEIRKKFKGTVSKILLKAY